MNGKTNFYLLSRFNNRTISHELGMPDYSYKFVEKYFFKSLSKIGNTVEVSDLDELPNQLSKQDYLFVFEPLHEVPEECLQSAIPVFAWEYSVLPDHESTDGKNYHWAEVLKKCRAALTHSSFTVESMEEAGVEIPIDHLRVPIYEQYSELPSKGETKDWSLKVEGLTWDSSALVLSATNKWDSQALVLGVREIQFTEVVYTYVFNPLDGRKRWEDAASGFIWAHNVNPDAVLILKLVHKDQYQAFKAVLNFLRRLGHFECRVVVIGGFLSSENLQQLIIHTDFAVNTSCGEGQCLPLLEFMSAGTPAVSPRHTAMSDYINNENSFVVEHTWGLVPWPNDEQRRYRCLNYPIIWESLCDAYRSSYEICRTNREQYLAMSDSAKVKMSEICSEKVFDSKIIEFISRL